MFAMGDMVYYSQQETDEARKDPAIIHYTTGVLGRPWETGCKHPKRKCYTDALEASPWKGMPLKPHNEPLLTKIAAFVSNYISTDLFVEIFRLMSKRYYR